MNRFTVFLVCVGVANHVCATEPPITAIVFSPDGRSVVACSQAGLQVLDWPELKSKRKIQVATLNLHDLAFSPSGNWLAVAGGTPAEDGTVEILSWPDGQSMRVIHEHFDSVMAISWRDDSTFASGGLDRRILLCDVDSGTILRELEGHSRGVTSLGFLRDQPTLVSVGIDQSVRVWNAESGELIRSLNIHTRPINGLDMRPGDHGLPMVVSTSEDQTVRMWQPTIGRMVRFAKLDARPLDVQWLPDGSRVAVSCTDGHVRLIDPDTVQVTRDLPVFASWAYSIAVHPSVECLVVGGREGGLHGIDLRRGD